MAKALVLLVAIGLMALELAVIYAARDSSEAQTRTKFRSLGELQRQSQEVLAQTAQIQLATSQLSDRDLPDAKRRELVETVRVSVAAIQGVMHPPTVVIPTDSPFQITGTPAASKTPVG